MKLFCDLDAKKRLHDKIVARLKPLPDSWRPDPSTCYTQDGNADRAVISPVTMKPRISPKQNEKKGAA